MCSACDWSTQRASELVICVFLCLRAVFCMYFLAIYCSIWKKSFVGWSVNVFSYTYTHTSHFKSLKCSSLSLSVSTAYTGTMHTVLIKYAHAAQSNAMLHSILIVRDDCCCCWWWRWWKSVHSKWYLGVHLLIACENMREHTMSTICALLSSFTFVSWFSSFCSMRIKFNHSKFLLKVYK